MAHAEVKKTEEKPKQLKGEERIDALCKALTENHGHVLPPEVYTPEE